MRGQKLLDYLQQDFMGLDTTYPLADGRITRRHYLDSAASTLAMRSAYQVAQQFLRHYSNTHSQLYFSARIATETYRWAHEQVLHFVHADPDRYTCFFTGNGSTAGFNRLARILALQRPERDVVLVSQMEHHSNDLPHRKYAKQVLHVPVEGQAPALGRIDLTALQELLSSYRGRVNYVAVTGASNVTGIINAIQEIARLAHAYDTWIIVDASQLLAHTPVQVCEPTDSECDLDFLVFSGHKIYAPGSPGVVVANRTLLTDQEPEEVGGGMVDKVYLEKYYVTTVFPEREEAGTPNIVGAIFLASVLELLRRIGMARIHEKEILLLNKLINCLSQIPEVQLYGCMDLRHMPRTGTIAFNLRGLDHGLVTAILNDYHNVSVRNECFCAHPFVREMLKKELWELEIDVDREDAQKLIKLKQGMVRASFGLYTTEADINALIVGIKDILNQREHYQRLYKIDADGSYYHRSFSIPVKSLFDPIAILNKSLLCCNE